MLWKCIGEGTQSYVLAPVSDSDPKIVVRILREHSLHKASAEGGPPETPLKLTGEDAGRLVQSRARENQRCAAVLTPFNKVTQSPGGRHEVSRSGTLHSASASRSATPNRRLYLDHCVAAARLQQLLSETNFIGFPGYHGFYDENGTRRHVLDGAQIKICPFDLKFEGVVSKGKVEEKVCFQLSGERGEKLVGYDFEVLEDCGKPIFVKSAQASSLGEAAAASTGVSESLHPDLQSLEQKRNFIAWLLMAVLIMHVEGYAHLDLKPDNVMIKYGLPKLIDYGNALPLDKCQDYLGSEGFALPEGGGGKFDGKKADIFALGLTVASILLKKRVVGEDQLIEGAVCINDALKELENSPEYTLVAYMTEPRLEKRCSNIRDVFDLAYFNKEGCSYDLKRYVDTARVFRDLDKVKNNGAMTYTPEKPQGASVEVSDVVAAGDSPGMFSELENPLKSSFECAMRALMLSRESLLLPASTAASTDMGEYAGGGSRARLSMVAEAGGRPSKVSADDDAVRNLGDAFEYSNGPG